MTSPRSKKPPAKAQRPRLTWAALFFIGKETIREWNDDKVPRLGAALAFYSVLSLGPLLLIVTAIAGVVFGEETVSRYMLAEIQNLIGESGAHAVDSILTHAQQSGSGLLATLIGVITLIVSATGFFAQLQDALNMIWNVDMLKERRTWFIKKRLLSFAMILGVGLLLLIGLVISAALAAFSSLVADIVPPVVLQGLNLIASYCVITVLFAMIFKFLPDVAISWRDVAIGALLTAALFELGKSLIGLYLGRSAFGSAYGAAGSLIVLLVWIYYSTQIFFLGAEFTQVYTRYMGEDIVIKKGRRRDALPVAGMPPPADTAKVVNVAKTAAGAQKAKPEM